MWNIIYHPTVQEDLFSLGTYTAKRVLNVISERMSNGEPNKIGKALSGSLSGYRRLRTGDIRIVYQANEALIEVYVLTIGPRRDEEVYELALKRALGR